MDIGRILGAVLQNQAARSAVNQQAMHRAVVPGGYGVPGHPAPVQPVAGGIIGNVLNGVLQEALRRNGQPVPGWQGPQAPFPGAPGYPVPQGPAHQCPEDYLTRATTILRAMVQAAKADGQVDAAEERAITSRMGHLSQQEIQFLQQEFARPIDVHGFAHSVPPGMEADVYTVSLMAIRLDTPNEGRYLHDLAECLRLPPQVVDQIHHQFGLPCPHR